MDPILNHPLVGLLISVALLAIPGVLATVAYLKSIFIPLIPAWSSSHTRLLALLVSVGYSLLYWTLGGFSAPVYRQFTPGLCVAVLAILLTLLSGGTQIGAKSLARSIGTAIPQRRLLRLQARPAANEDAVAEAPPAAERTELPELRRTLLSMPASKRPPLSSQGLDALADPKATSLEELHISEDDTKSLLLVAAQISDAPAPAERPAEQARAHTFPQEIDYTVTAVPGRPLTQEDVAKALKGLTVKRMVSYWSHGSPDGTYKSEERAAVIVGLSRENQFGRSTRVSLLVMTNQGFFLNHNVPFTPEQDAGHWSWGGRV